MKAFILLVCFVAYCAAQKPNPCQSPQQYEARIYRSDRKFEFSERAKISYDELDRRVRVIEEVEQGRQRDFFDTLYLHNVNMMYRLNIRTRRCNVTALNRPFRPFGIPREGKYVFEATLGAAGVPGENLVVQAFDGQFSDGAYFFAEATYPSCFPLRSGYYSRDTGFVDTRFYDITNGIADPTVFIPPSECTM